MFEIRQTYLSLISQWRTPRVASGLPSGQNRAGDARMGNKKIDDIVVGMRVWLCTEQMSGPLGLGLVWISRQHQEGGVQYLLKVGDWALASI